MIRPADDARIGLRGDILARQDGEWPLKVEDVSDFVAEQRENARAPYDRLAMPKEDVYPVADVEVARRLGVLSLREVI